MSFRILGLFLFARSRALLGKGSAVGFDFLGKKVIWNDSKLRMVGASAAVGWLWGLLLAGFGARGLE
jgi:hypothetical protein